MIDDIFVFDNVIHVYDMSEANVRPDDAARQGRDSMLAIGGALRWPGFASGGMQFDKRWTAEEMYDLVFVQSPTDMAMAQVVPIFEWYKDFFAPVAAQYAMAQRYPDAFCSAAASIRSTAGSTTPWTRSTTRSASSARAR